MKPQNEVYTPVYGIHWSATYQQLLYTNSKIDKYGKNYKHTHTYIHIIMYIHTCIYNYYIHIVHSAPYCCIRTSYVRVNCLATVFLLLHSSIQKYHRKVLAIMVSADHDLVSNHLRLTNIAKFHFFQWLCTLPYLLCLCGVGMCIALIHESCYTWVRICDAPQILAEVSGTVLCHVLLRGGQ